MTSQIKSGAILAYVAIFVNIATGLLYTPWMIHQIGISDYGLYALISSFLSYFMLDFGLGTAVSRYIAKFRVQGKIEEINNLISLIIKAFCVIDMVIFIILLILFFYIEQIFTGLTAEEINKFKFIYCIAGGFSLLTFPFSYLNGVLIAYEKFVLLKSCDLIYRVLVVFIMILCLSLGYGLYALVFTNGVVGFGIAVFKFYCVSKRTIINLRFFDYKLLKELLIFSSWIFVIAIFSRLMYNIIPSLLGHYCDSSQVAIFSIAMMIEGYLYTFASALNGLFLPRVTNITNTQNYGWKLTLLMVRVGRIQLLVVGAIISGFILLGKSFVALWVGYDLIDSYYAAICLIIPGAVSLIEEIANTALIATNELKYRAFIFIISSVISIILGIIFSQLYGALGSAIAVFISLILCHIIGMNILYSRKIKIKVYFFFKNTLLKYLPSLFLSVLLFLIISRFLNVNGWIGFIIKGLIYASILFIVCWFLYLENAERTMFYSIIKGFRRK